MPRDTFVATAKTCLTALLAVCCLLRPMELSGKQPDLEILSILEDMGMQGDRFRPDRLHGMAAAGLSALLDRFLPDTADPTHTRALQDSVAELVGRLGHESYRVRETATERLLNLGPVFAPSLLRAVGSPDAEISWRATKILRKWEADQKQGGNRQVDAFAVYLEGVADEERLQQLARRTLIGLQAGMPEGMRHKFLLECLRAVARCGQDVHSNLLAPLLKHKDVELAVLVTETMGSASGGDYFPAILLDALKADREEVVATAVKWSSNCQDGSKKAEVKKCLIAIFKGDNSRLKFAASFPLLHDFNYAEAVDYLLTEVRSENKQHRARAMKLIGDRRHLGTPVSDKILEALRPMLRADDSKTRLAAVRTLSIYSGQEVVESLIPLLGDRKAMIATEVAYRLDHQTDKAMLRRLLAEAAKDNANEKIRRKAAEIVKKLDQAQ